MFDSATRIYKYLGPKGLAIALYYALLTKVARLARKRLLRRRVFNYSLLLDTNDQGLSRTLLLFGRREIDHYRMLHAAASPGMTIFDIGANIGYYAVMESLIVGDDGRIIAIEPIGSNVELLRKNVALNGVENIEIIQGAVSDSTGSREMFVSSHSNLHTFHRDGTASATLSSESIPVTTFTLKDLMDRSGKPDLIRMDVEGHEVEILGDLARQARDGAMAPKVIFETHLSRYKDDHDLVPVLRDLFSVGYEVRTASSSGEAGTTRLERMGYRGSDPFYSDLGWRVLFDHLKDDDAIELICRSGGVRTILLEKVHEVGRAIAD